MPTQCPLRADYATLPLTLVREGEEIWLPPFKYTLKTQTEFTQSLQKSFTLRSFIPDSLPRLKGHPEEPCGCGGAGQERLASPSAVCQEEG